MTSTEDKSATLPTPSLTKRQEIDAALGKEKIADDAKEAKILEFLKGKLLVPTIDIAKHLQPKGYRASQVNPPLYDLADRGKLIKTCKPNGSNPRWTLA